MLAHTIECMWERRISMFPILDTNLCDRPTRSENCARQEFCLFIHYLFFIHFQNGYRKAWCWSWRISPAKTKWGMIFLTCTYFAQENRIAQQSEKKQSMDFLRSYIITRSYSSLVSWPYPVIKIGMGDNEQYGNTGCGVFKRGYKIRKVFA